MQCANTAWHAHARSTRPTLICLAGPCARSFHRLRSWYLLSAGPQNRSAARAYLLAPSPAIAQACTAVSGVSSLQSDIDDRVVNHAEDLVLSANPGNKHTIDACFSTAVDSMLIESHNYVRTALAAAAQPSSHAFETTVRAHS